MTANDYLIELQALLPRGAAWPRDVDAVLTKTLQGLAEELARVDARIADLMREADPRITSELLLDWERVTGLPDPCVTDPQTAEQRRNAVVSRLTSVGGQSKQYFIDLAAEIGATITIDEFQPHTVMSPVNAPLYGIAWRFAWRVNGISNPITYATVLSFVNDPLATWGNTGVECLFNRLKPAHTTVIYNYS